MLRWYKNLYLGNTVKGQGKKAEEKAGEGETGAGDLACNDCLQRGKQSGSDTGGTSSSEIPEGSVPYDRRDGFYPHRGHGDSA